MPLRRFQRQYEQLSQFKRERIIGMIEAGWSARRVARLLGHSVLLGGVATSGSERCHLQEDQAQNSFRQTSCREDRHIVIKPLAQPTASSAAIQAQVAPSLGAHLSSRTIRRHLPERHLG
ncbi:transposable element Tcb2 transposase [Trichonephila clavipes]|uniref:Transposable element Tcb2 transposase n=1 Tax=Trichonephila clavipes TaxID=2585209 RepID=A0A8X6RAH8_TRICX|nr:transposable element Tcb2 transposase [Trichonephila clavipes]